MCYCAGSRGGRKAQWEEVEEEKERFKKREKEGGVGCLLALFPNCSAELDDGRLAGAHEKEFVERRNVNESFSGRNTTAPLVHAACVRVSLCSDPVRGERKILSEGQAARLTNRPEMLLHYKMSSPKRSIGRKGNTQ